MNLYLVTQDINNNYDTYDSMVVAAQNEELASKLHPRPEYYIWDYANNKGWCWLNKDNVPSEPTEYQDDWALPSQVKVKFIGIASADIAEGSIICASFNAG